MKISTRIVTSTIVCLCWLTSATAEVPSAKNAKTALTTQGTKKVLDLFLKSARKQISALNDELVNLENKRQDVNSQEGTQITRLAKARTAHEENEKSLRKALNENYRTETTALIVPRITELHQSYLSFVDRYRAQTGIVPNDPSYIEGTTRTLRTAMAEIVQSQNKDLQRIKDIVRNRMTFLNQTQEELNLIRQNTNTSQTRFGFDHYLNLLLQKVDAQREIAQTSTVIINAKDYLSRSTQPVLRCNETQTITPFTAILSEVAALSKTYSSFKDFTDNVSTQIMSKYYLSKNNIPTYITHWSGCSTNQRNNADNFRRDVERELARNNRELAKQLDRERANLEYEMTVTLEELDTLINHQNQIDSITRSAANQTVDGLGSNSSAWGKTVLAHTSNLTAGAEFYPAIMRATDDLLKRASDELRTLGTLTDPVAQSAEIAIVNEKLLAIREAGFSRLIEQIDSVNDQLQTMSLSIAGGELFLSDTLNSYAIGTRTKALFWKSEQDKLPAVLAASATAASLARDTYTKSLSLLKVATEDVELCSLLKNKLFDNIDTLKNKFGNSRFNPIYSELTNKLLEPVKQKKEYKQAKTQIDQMIKDYLASFSGILEKKPGKVIYAEALAKKPRAGNGPLFAPLNKNRLFLSKNILGVINMLSASYLERRTISEVLAESKNQMNRIMAMPA
jgi:hypothetical protein